jgi:long-chain acyl-CoA synthetase
VGNERGIADSMSAPTLPAALQSTAQAVPEQPALRSLAGPAITWGEYAERVRAIAGGLARLGVGRRDTVALMLANRPETHLVDAAALHLGAVPFSIYNTSAPEQIAYLLANAECRVVVSETRFTDQIRSAGGTDAFQLVLVDGEAPDALTLAQLEGLDSDLDFEAGWRAVRPQDTATIIYTSGTTGPPKGVELSHENILAAWRATASVLPVPAAGRVVSYLPFAHIFDRFSTHYLAMVSGACVTCVNDASLLAQALLETRPTIFGAVPRIWEKLRLAMLSQMSAEPDLTAIHAHALAELRRAEAAGREPALGADARAAGEAVLERIGLDRALWVASGAAPIGREVLDFFVAFGLRIIEGFGMSEVAGIALINPLERPRIGTVGQPLPGVDVRLAGDGELLIRGDMVMQGYRNDREQTAAALAGGWLHTGDLASIDGDGYVTIIDRKKELIINAAGKNMSPANIELALTSAGGLIEQACVIGDARPYNVALLTLSEQARAGYGTAPALEAAIEQEVAEANARLSRIEQVKRFAVIDDEWLPDGDELTPTLKLKRRVIAEKHAAVIEELYA